jgi:benzoate/toluate 1,2-dioxygenase subunit beta
MSRSTLVETTAVADFLYEEGRLLDSHDYDAWLELWAADGYYWMPADRATDPDTQVAILADNRMRLEQRVRQLQTGYRHAQLPQSSTQHFITNILVSDGDAADEVLVHSSYLVVEARFGQIQLWTGQATHVLRVADDGSLAIVRKTFRIINEDLPLPSMGFIP